MCEYRDRFCLSFGDKKCLTGLIKLSLKLKVSLKIALLFLAGIGDLFVFNCGNNIYDFFFGEL